MKVGSVKGSGLEGASINLKLLASMRAPQCIIANASVIVFASTVVSRLSILIWSTRKRTLRKLKRRSGGVLLD